MEYMREMCLETMAYHAALALATLHDTVLIIKLYMLSNLRAQPAQGKYL